MTSVSSSMVLPSSVSMSFIASLVSGDSGALLKSSNVSKSSCLQLVSDSGSDDLKDFQNLNVSKSSCLQFVNDSITFSVTVHANSGQG